MESNNAQQPVAADQAITAASRYSRYLLRLLTANTAVMLSTELDQPFSAADMQSELAAAAITDDPGLCRALRRLRQRVIARLIARDLSGRADLNEVVGTVTQLAEITIRTAVTRLHEDLVAIHGEPRCATDGA